MVDKQDSKSGSKQIKLAWSRGDHLDPVLVDHLQLQILNDHVYLMFGQIRPAELISEEPVAEIRPVVRVVMTPATLKKVADVLNKHVGKE